MPLDALRTRASSLLAVATMAILVAACGAGATTAPTIQASASTVSVATTGLGQVLVGPSGKTLYMFDKDTTANQSACAAGGCLTTWPALIATGTPTAGAGVSGTLATFARAEGPTQVSYNGKPLHYYAGDTKPGDTMGDGIGGVWHAAKP